MFLIPPGEHTHYYLQCALPLEYIEDNNVYDSLGWGCGINIITFTVHPLGSTHYNVYGPQGSIHIIIFNVPPPPRPGGMHIIIFNVPPGEGGHIEYNKKSTPRGA